MRCFISIDIPENIKKEIKKIQEQLPEFIGKKTEVGNLHLTLKFLGEVSDEKIKLVKEKLKEIKIKKFESEMGNLGYFDNRKSKIYSRNLIVWLHLTNCDRLQKEIDNSLKGLFKLEQRFMSHLTIARVKSVKDKEKFLRELKKIKIPKIKFVADKFKLKSSVLKPKGPVYGDIEVYDLT